jgi:hypothetical protein
MNDSLVPKLRDWFQPLTHLSKNKKKEQMNDSLSANRRMVSATHPPLQESFKMINEHITLNFGGAKIHKLLLPANFLWVIFKNNSLTTNQALLC